MDIVLTCRRIWAGYKMYAKGASVIRKGYENVGASEIAEDDLNFRSTFRRRGESILEHQAKTAWLVSAFASNFPDYFGSDHADYIYPVMQLLLITGLCHDVGELEIGDIPDNGNPLHDVKDQAELVVFEDFVQAFDVSEREEIVKLYQAFQSKDSYLGQALFALDKCESILTHLLLESQGIYGNISANPNPTDLEKYYAAVSGSDFAADIWGAQVKDKTKDFPLTITTPVFTLLNVAALNVRKRNFTWLCAF